MIDTKTAPYAALILRVVTGVLFLIHGLVKLFVFTPAGTAGYFQSIGLPGWLGYATMLIEIIGGLALILGVGTRLVALVMVPVMLGAALFGHAGNGFTFSNPGGGWEYPVMWAFVMAAIAALGDGAYALKPLGRKSAD
ncbi:DoxX family protein [Pseudooceanicola sediminis]|uniref:DoxX family protein n=1 Tax=Pseudooceanicola sediminis TaxID=2211117 RepID=A0A399J2F9_9RHOB|nr:DoxX family protein [Pseudooceanicola sediminis]KAA2315013.1 DoxX family protein [Puniceibacterium sp. HSS470]RII38827.1 DoxX family protein [Pseudooceanicola sediminis]|tara:strand:+ start:5934 stop:6347 length:414 start_codon:yes stop_codon:yes gene_type:complete